MSTNQAWVTLATNDSYCLGALVLAQSLKRAHTIYPIAVLITPGVSPAMRELLSTDFDLVQEVNVLDSGDAANLALMARPELGITFTKLHCWTLTQYSKCVFLDADTIVLRNCDELFERDELSAAPDVGWPDCFNSGVFVYKPSDDTYKALLEHAIAHGSFDGGDQGLLNQFFADWATKSIEKHLPFIYNMVSSAFYSYLPAFKKYGANVKIAHFIGGNKPWLSPLPSSSALTSFLDIWWNIFRSDVAHRLNTNMIINNSVFEAEPNATEVPSFSPNPTNPDRHVFVDPWEEYETEVQIDSRVVVNGTVGLSDIPNAFHNNAVWPSSQQHRGASPPVSDRDNDNRPQIRYPSVVHVRVVDRTDAPQCFEMPQNHSRLLQRHDQETNTNSRDNVPRPEQPLVPNIFAEPVRLLKKIGEPELVAEPQSGLAGALAAGERDEIELQWRKQSWEQGNIDYMGRDSFDNIWKKISETVGLGETLPPKTPPAEASVKLSDILQKSAPTSESQTSESSAQKSAPVTQSSFENALKIVSAASVAVAIPSQPAPETTMVPPIDVTMPTPPPSSTISSSPPIPAAPTTKPLFPPMDAPLATPPPAAVETPITTPAQPAAAPPLVTAAVVPPAQVVTPIATVVPPLAQAPATPPSVAICPEAPATVAICPEAPAAVAICPEAPATVAICPTAPAPVAVCPEAPAPIAVCPEAPAPIAVCPEAPAPLAICPEAPPPVAICPTAPAPVAVCPEAPAPVAVCPEAPAPVAVCPEAPAPVAVCPEAPAPVAICPESPAPVAISPAAPAPVAICPEAPTTPKQQPDKPAQKQAEQGKKGGQKSQQKGGAKQSQQSPPKTPPTEVPSSSPPAAQSPAVPSLSSPAAPEPAHQPESPPQVKPTVQAASAPSPSQTATTPSQVEAAPVPPKRKGNQKSGKGKK